MKAFAFAGSGLLALASVVQAQSPPPAATPSFEVVSIKRNTDQQARVELGGGRFLAKNVTVRELIRMAYPVGDRGRGDDQLVGGDGWPATDRFDVEAIGAPADAPRVTPGMVAPPPGAAITRVQEMLRNLLADRFKLKVHHEQRPLRMFALTRVSRDRLGAQLRPSDANCVGEAAPPNPELPRCGGFRVGGGRMAGRAVTMGALVSLLSGMPFIGRPVEDRTALQGAFDFTLTFSRDGQNAAAAGADGPSVFTALAEQLGLRLESIEAPGDVVVIDSVEQPTSN